MGDLRRVQRQKESASCSPKGQWCATQIQMLPNVDNLENESASALDCCYKPFIRRRDPPKAGNDFQMPDFPVNFQVTFTEITSTIQVSVVVPSTVTTSVTRTSVVGSVATSTLTTSTQATTQIGGVVTAVVTSTAIANTSQTQANVLTLFITVSTSVTSVATSVEDPVLELSLAAIILFSVAIIAISAIRRSPGRATIVCPHCGVTNSSTKFCVSCGEPLKRARTQ